MQTDLYFGEIEYYYFGKNTPPLRGGVGYLGGVNISLLFFIRICYDFLVQELKAKPRKELGKKVNAIRRAGFLPAVLYGEGTLAQPISISSKDFGKTYEQSGESTLVILDVEGKKHNVLIHDVKYDPLKGSYLHADFYAVRMDRTIRATVPIEFEGESPAVKNLSGIPVKVMQEVEVEALPQDLPHALNADLSLLNELESKLLVKDLKLPSGVKLHAEPDEIIFLIESPRSEEELAALKEAPVVEAPAEAVKTVKEIEREHALQEKAKEEAVEGSR